MANRIAFIVEGLMEQRIVQKLCPKNRVIRLGLNGKNAPLSKMAGNAANIIKNQLRNNCPILIVFDCEKRKQTASAVQSRFQEELAKQPPAALHKFDVVVVDKSTESWFYPFLQADLSLSSQPLPNQIGEGQTTKPLVKKIFKQKRRPYTEIDDGGRLFCALDPAAVGRISPSFERLAGLLEPHCPRWLGSKRG